MGNNCVLGQRRRIVSGCHVRRELERVGIVLTRLLFTVFSFVQRSFLTQQLSQAVRPAQRCIKITESISASLSLTHRNYQFNGPWVLNTRPYIEVGSSSTNAHDGSLNVGRKLFRLSNPKSKSILALSRFSSPCAICQLIVSQRCQ